MILSFELTMPNRGSWNGKWSGQDKKYFIIRSISMKYIRSKDFLHRLTLSVNRRENFYYRWSDGWGANVCVEVIDSAEAKRRRKLSSGFCGYDWMVDSIIYHGVIQTESDRKLQTTNA